MPSPCQHAWPILQHTSFARSISICRCTRFSFCIHCVSEKLLARGTRSVLKLRGPCASSTSSATNMSAPNASASWCRSRWVPGRHRDRSGRARDGGGTRPAGDACIWFCSPLSSTLSLHFPLAVVRAVVMLATCSVVSMSRIRNGSACWCALVRACTSMLCRTLRAHFCNTSAACARARARGQRHGSGGGDGSGSGGCRCADSRCAGLISEFNTSCRVRVSPQSPPPNMISSAILAVSGCCRSRP